MKKYHPSPIDTSTVVLTSDQTELIEQLAKNAHEIWAEKRLSDGWTYGRERNDQLKTRASRWDEDITANQVPSLCCAACIHYAPYNYIFD
ncbi:MAG: RyR domain-containing protein [Pseudomonadota bacterium]